MPWLVCHASFGVLSCHHVLSYIFTSRMARQLTIAMPGLICDTCSCLPRQDLFASYIAMPCRSWFSTPGLICRIYRSATANHTNFHLPHPLYYSPTLVKSFFCWQITHAVSHGACVQFGYLCHFRNWPPSRLYPWVLALLMWKLDWGCGGGGGGGGLVFDGMCSSAQSAVQVLC